MQSGQFVKWTIPTYDGGMYSEIVEVVEVYERHAIAKKRDGEFVLVYNNEVSYPSAQAANWVYGN
jgi:hypothetical protein